LNAAIPTIKILIQIQSGPLLCRKGTSNHQVKLPSIEIIYSTAIAHVAAMTQLLNFCVT